MSEVINLIIHIMSSLPEKCEVAIIELKERLKDTSNPLGVESIREKLNSRSNISTRTLRKARKTKRLRHS